MPGSLRLVVARHTEDLGWLREVPKHWNVSVVTKGVHLPNTGREASSYLYAMEKFYEDDGWLMFVQGDPFAHFPHLLEALPAKEYSQQFVPVTQYVAESDAAGGPHHWEPLPVKEWYEDFVGPWPGSVLFYVGAQFMLPAWIMRGRTKNEFRELRERVCAEETGAWTIERLWHRLFVS